MNTVGIDVSKGKSMVAVLRPLGVVVAKPFGVGYTDSKLEELARFLISLDGEIMDISGAIRACGPVDPRTGTIS